MLYKSFPLSDRRGKCLPLQLTSSRSQFAGCVRLSLSLPLWLHLRQTLSVSLISGCDHFPGRAPQLTLSVGCGLSCSSVCVAPAAVAPNCPSLSHTLVLFGLFCGQFELIFFGGGGLLCLSLTGSSLLLSQPERQCKTQLGCVCSASTCLLSLS